MLAARDRAGRAFAVVSKDSKMAHHSLCRHLAGQNEMEDKKKENVQKNKKKNTTEVCSSTSCLRFGGNCFVCGP